MIRKLTCDECGKHYDYDVDDFCPKCGAFNRPEKRSTVSRVEGMNEDNHQNSFAHTELHDENRNRRGGDLVHGTQQMPKYGTAQGTMDSSQREERKKTELDTTAIKKIIGFIIGVIVVMNILLSLLRL